ncbi:MULTISPECIES: hypothetical protein [unclassified Streptomyces]|uniref:hypothetical protein n=1 Tax=unclassified Streptomyces TaxID=2593676 RepID=UPI003369F0BA
MSAAGAPRPGDIAMGISQLEGYLLLQAERDWASDRARRFAGRLEWLTVAQREEVERLYAQDQWDLTEQTLRKVARRGEELKAEYQRIYRRLRLRLLVAALLGGVALTVVAVVLGAG